MAVLCFVGSEWSLLPSPLLFDPVRVVWSKGLVKLVETTKSSTTLGTIDIASGSQPLSQRHDFCPAGH